MTEIFKFKDLKSLTLVCGVNDKNISYIEDLLSVKLGLRGDVVLLISDDMSKTQILIDLLQRLQVISLLKDSILESDIYMEYKRIIDSSEKMEDICLNVGNKCIYPKTKNQSLFISSLKTSSIVFSYGPAGTGKTFLAVSYALAELLQNKIQKIVFTRPVVEAGENLGFLPGDLTQKLDPYLRPFYDSLEFFLPSNVIHRYIDNNQIEIIPLAYMRGRSLNNAFIILDEAQNTIVTQMKMFLTRIGENSTAVITGDLTQTDLTNKDKSGLYDAIKRLQNIEGINFIEFSSKDTVRSRIVQRILDAYQS